MACKLTTNTISSIPSPLTLSTATCVCGLPFVFIFINYCILSMKMKRMLDLKLRNEQNSNSNVIYSPCCKLRFQIDRFIFFFCIEMFYPVLTTDSILIQRDQVPLFSFIPSHLQIYIQHVFLMFIALKMTSKILLYEFDV